MKQFRIGSAKLAVGLLSALVAGQGLAVVPPQDDARSKIEYRHPDLYVAQANENVARVPGLNVAAALERLQAPVAGAFVDLRTGRYAALQPVQPLLPGKGVRNTLAWSDLGRSAPQSDTELAAAAWDAFAAWLTRHSADLRIDPTEVVAPGRVTVLSPDHIVIWAPRRVAGVAVRDAALLGTIRHGNLVLFGADNWADVEGFGLAELTAADATRALERNLTTNGLGAAWKAPELAWVPVSSGDELAASDFGRGLSYRLAWVLRYDLTEAGGRWEALVDARDGTLLQVADTRHYGVATPRQVSGGVYPVSNDGVPPDGVEQPNWPMPFESVTTPSGPQITDAGGNLINCVDGSITSDLNGQFVMMSDVCGAISLSGTGNLNFGVSGGDDCVTPGIGGAGNTHSSRTGFFELNQLKHMARSQLPENLWLQDQLTANMNINSTCNAFWNGITVNFYRSGGGCGNTGEIAAIFDHEWGHGMDNNDAVPAVSNPGEGIADIYASLRLDSSCIGRGFTPGSNCGGYGNACTACTGVREIDWALHTQNTPLTITLLQAQCPGGGGICAREVHCEGQITGQAVWDLWNRDLLGAPFNYNLDRSRELATLLTYRGSSGVTNWFTCNQGNGGCAATNGYKGYLAADDDNGDLNDGTPHMTAIFAAYNRHGIACATPAPVNAGCAGTPTTAPVVTGSPRDRGAKLTWAPVSGATAYRIFRTDGVFGCGFGKILLATTTETSYEDVGLQNGRQYSYNVIPMGADDSCLGPASSCTNVTPAAGPNLRADVGAATFVGQTGDGDAFIDNCEIFRLTLPLSNLGTGALTNVEIVGAESPSHPGTTFEDPFPIAVSPSLASCSGANAVLDFVASGVAEGDLFELVLELDADEFAGDHRFVAVTYANTEGDFQLQASRTFDFETNGDQEGWVTTAGTFHQDTAGGGGGGSARYMESSEFLDGQCDVVQSPLLRLTATSTMQMFTRVDVEPLSDAWYDRANIGIVAGNGNRTVLVPSAGRAYNASGINGTCGTANAQGWAGSMNTWATSDWSSTAMQTGTFAGQPIHLQMNYGTDPLVNGDGIHFDRVMLTNTEWQVADQQSDSCSDTMPFFGDFETGDSSQWSSTVP